MAPRECEIGGRYLVLLEQIFALSAQHIFVFVFAWGNVRQASQVRQGGKYIQKLDDILIYFKMQHIRTFARGSNYQRHSRC